MTAGVTILRPRIRVKQTHLATDVTNLEHQENHTLLSAGKANTPRLEFGMTLPGRTPSNTPATRFRPFWADL